MCTDNNIWKALFELHATDATMKLVGFLLSLDCDEAEMSDKEVSYWTGYSDKTVKKSRVWLSDNGFVRIVAGKYKGSKQVWSMDFAVIAANYSRNSKWEAIDGTESRNRKQEPKGGTATICDITEPSVNKVFMAGTVRRNCKEEHKGTNACAHVSTKKDNNIFNNNILAVKDKHQACARGKVGGLGLSVDEPEEPKKTRREFRPPTLDEVVAYFSTHQGVLATWMEEAQSFFNNFEAVGWIDAAGRRIVSWERKADRWCERAARELNQFVNKNYRNEQERFNADAQYRQQVYARYFAEKFARERQGEDVELAY